MGGITGSVMKSFGLIIMKIAATILLALMVMPVMLLATAPHWLSADAVNLRLAVLTTPVLGEPARVAGFSWCWRDGLGLALEGVSIGQRATIETIEVTPAWRTLPGQLKVQRLAVIGARIDLPGWQKWWQARPASKGGKNVPGVERVSLQDVRIKPWAGQLGSLNGALEFAEDWQLESGSVTIGTMMIQAEPADQGYELRAIADRWQFPLGTGSLALDQFSSEGRWHPVAGEAAGQLTLTLRAEGAEVPGVNFDLEQLAINAEITNRMVTLHSLQVSGLGGKLVGSGSGGLQPAPQWQFELELMDLDLAAVADNYGLDRLAGDLSASGGLEFNRLEDQPHWQVAGNARINDFFSERTGLQFPAVESPFRLDRQGIDLSALMVSGYEGTIQSGLALRWRDGFVAEGDIRLNNLAVEPLMRDLQFPLVTGMLYGAALFKWRRGTDPALAGLDLNGQWEINNGFFPGINLRALSGLMTRSNSATPGTAFDVASSDIKILGSEIELTNMDIKSSVLAADGQLKIAENGSLLGELRVGGNESIGVTRVPIDISGTLAEPRLRAPKSSLVGGAVGSVILGPGLGTAVGVKLGEGFNNLQKKLFGSDE